MKWAMPRWQDRVLYFAVPAVGLLVFAGMVILLVLVAKG